MREKRAKVPYEGAEQNVALVQALVGQTTTLALRSREAHWNVKGSNFGPLHELFGDFYDFMNDWADTLAERVVQQGSVAQAINGGWEPRPTVGDETSLIKEIAVAANTLAQDINSALLVIGGTEDKTTEDILIEFGRDLEKWVWKIESHLMDFQKVGKKAAQDPGREVLVHGYGRLGLNQVKQKVKSYTDDVKRFADSENWGNCAWFAYKNGVLQALLETIEREEPRA
jgi:starvation-inducible DNA-binding protein